jgi:YHS domain-containing protein
VGFATKAFHLPSVRAVDHTIAASRNSVVVEREVVVMAPFPNCIKLGSIILLILAASATGCSQGSAGNRIPASDSSSTVETHAHLPGEHGGLIVPIGHDQYHAEPVFASDGSLRLYMLGPDESQVLEVERQTIAAYVTKEQEFQAALVELKPAPQRDDAPDKTSVFAGRLPEELQKLAITVVIPSIRIAQTRFRFSFHSGDDGASQMPQMLTSSRARDLFLTPKGLYTAADIAANGSTTAAEKYRGFHSTHDFNPKPGDPICPVTHTKANPNCTWIVGGKKYLFCCPPCIDEFVKLARETPEKIKSPAEYVKQ